MATISQAPPGLPCNVLARQVLGLDALMAMDRSNPVRANSRFTPKGNGACCLDWPPFSLFPGGRGSPAATSGDAGEPVAPWPYVFRRSLRIACPCSPEKQEKNRTMIVIALALTLFRQGWKIHKPAEDLTAGRDQRDRILDLTGLSWRKPSARWQIGEREAFDFKAVYGIQSVYT